MEPVTQREGEVWAWGGHRSHVWLGTARSALQATLLVPFSKPLRAVPGRALGAAGGGGEWKCLLLAGPGWVAPRKRVASTAVQEAHAYVLRRCRFCGGFWKFPQ